MQEISYQYFIVNNKSYTTNKNVKKFNNLWTSAVQ